MHQALNWYWELLLAIVLFFIYKLVYWFLLWRIKQQVDMPTRQVPMLLCEKNHLYPEDQTLSITVDGLNIKICPFCYNNNLQETEKFKYESSPEGTDWRVYKG